MYDMIAGDISMRSVAVDLPVREAFKLDLLAT